ELVHHQTGHVRRARQSDDDLHPLLVRDRRAAEQRPCLTRTETRGASSSSKTTKKPTSSPKTCLPSSLSRHTSSHGCGTSTLPSMPPNTKCTTCAWSTTASPEQKTGSTSPGS